MQAPPRGSGLIVGAALLGLALVGLLALLFADRFRELYALWNSDDNYSHGFLVPLVSAWLAWEVLRRQGLSGDGALRPGLFWIGMGCVLHLWAVIIWWPPIDFLALAALLYGFAVLAGGRAWAQGFLFPILFLFFMFPLSPVLLNKAATGLQGLVTEVGTWLLQLFVPTYHQGNKIFLPGTQLEVGEQCSGVRQIVAFAALTLLVAYLSKRRLPFRIGILLAGVPIAIAANLLRVLLMAFLVMNFGPGAISEKNVLVPGISYHTAWGLLTMAAGLGLLLGVACWLGRVFPTPTTEGAKEEETSPRPPIVLSPGLVRRLGGAVLCLGVAGGAQLALQAHLAAANDRVARSTYLKRPLQGEGDKGFPVSLGAWSGREVTPDPATLPFYNAADDRLNRAYVQKDEHGQEYGPQCMLWMVHFRNGEDRNHHPLICYKVAGCSEEPSGRLALPMKTGDPIQRFGFTRGDERSYPSYVYYWHYTFEPADEAGLSVVQRLHADWAVRPSLTVQVFTTAQAPEQLDQVADFVRRVDEQLQAHLPPGAHRGSETLPITMRR
jgi:exosortase